MMQTPHHLNRQWLHAVEGRSRRYAISKKTIQNKEFAKGVSQDGGITSLSRQSRDRLWKEVGL